MEGPEFSCEDMEFFATWDEVTVIPNYSGDKLSCICGEFGPFNPSVPVSLPLFLALNLKQSKKCRIQPPDWLTKAKLEEVLERERENSELAVDLRALEIPFHYNAIAHVLLLHAADDITTAGGHSEVHDCRRLLRDIEDVRSSKIRKGTKMVMEQVKKTDHVHEVSKLINFRNLVFAELNQVRPTLKLALDTLADINPKEIKSDSGIPGGGGVRRPSANQGTDEEPRRKLRRFRK